MPTPPAGSVFEFDYTPGVTKPTSEYGTEWGSTGYKDEFLAPKVAELLKHYNAFTQRGVTLAGGQGVLPTGCVIAQRTSNQKYYAYAAAASDGTQNVLGVLRDARDTGGTGSPIGMVSTDCQANMVIRGILDLSLVSGTDTTSLVAGSAGGLGSGAAGAVTQLKARVDAVNGLFLF